jgi:hypothetical protein
MLTQEQNILGVAGCRFAGGCRPVVEGLLGSLQLVIRHGGHKLLPSGTRADTVVPQPGGALDQFPAPGVDTGKPDQGSAITSRPELILGTGKADDLEEDLVGDVLKSGGHFLEGKVRREKSGGVRLPFGLGRLQVSNDFEFLLKYGP